MSELRETLDYIQSKRFKKETGYESTLTKMLNQATKAKAGKAHFEVRSKGDAMKFRAKGKKAAPVNMLDYSKIRNLKKTSSDKKAIAFAYPGPDEKSPIMLYALRFEKEEAYEKFTEHVEFPPSSEYQGGRFTPTTTGRTSRYAEQDYRENGSLSPWDSYGRSKSRTHTRHSSHSTSSSVSSSLTQHRISRAKSSERMKEKIKSTYISTDKMHLLYGKRSPSPRISLRSPYSTSYVYTKSRIYDFPSPCRRASPIAPRNLKVRRVYRVTRGSSIDSSSTSPSWASASSSISDLTELEFISFESSTSSSDYSSDEDYD